MKFTKQKINFKTRLIHSINEVDIKINFLGKDYKNPIFIAPVTGATTNLNGSISELDYARYVIKGAIDSGSIAFVGDGASTNKYKLIYQVIKHCINV